MSARPLLAAVLLGALAAAWPAGAHEIRPAYLEVTEIAPGRWTVLWRTPVLSGRRLPVRLALPEGVRDAHPPTVQELTDSLLERRTIDAGEHGLDGVRIAFVGLEATITDVLVRVARLDGTAGTTLVRPSEPWVRISGPMGRLAVVRAYWVHGVEHILFGFDHLLFVLALVLIVRGRRTLYLTITAFTLAHSITLGLATLGVMNVPGPPVEAAIALSILLLAVEIVRAERGEVGFSVRWPWVVAFAFGLLHGFGFAGALADLGLPPADVPLAHLAFNLGVECGQLGFVAALFALSGLLARAPRGAHLGRRVLAATPYAIGTLAAFWFFERLARF
jgi:hydrogenase/urease accessory protein HupE